MCDAKLPTHHPSEERLLDYATGAASEPVSLLIATHLSYCARCRAVVDELQQIGGALIEDLAPVPLGADSLDRMMARLELPEAQGEDDDQRRRQTLNPTLPAPLAAYLDRPLDELSWRRRGAISEYTLMPDRSDHATRLLWIKAGSSTPRHTHQGSELTLVLKGSFQDGHGLYGCGDVEEADSDVDHSPVAGFDGDCLCLAVTDAPLRLTSPLGRLINPFVNI